MRLHVHDAIPGDRAKQVGAVGYRPGLQNFGQRVLEMIRMPPALNDRRHASGQTRQFTGAGIRHYADGLLRRAARHYAALL
jgi:hypothetical protein